MPFLLLLCCVACVPPTVGEDGSASISNHDDNRTSNSGDGHRNSDLDRFADAYVGFLAFWESCITDWFSDTSNFYGFHSEVQRRETQGWFTPRSREEIRSWVDEHLSRDHVVIDEALLTQCTSSLLSVPKVSCGDDYGHLLGTNEFYQANACMTRLINGALEVGEPCEPGQCADGICGDEGGGCECFAYSTIGEACGGHGVGCDVNSYCDSDDDGNSVCVPYAELNEPCDDDAQCRRHWGAACIEGECQVGAAAVNDEVSALPGEEGERCNTNAVDFCVEGLVCESWTDRFGAEETACVVPPSVGETCLDEVIVKCGSNASADCVYQTKWTPTLICGAGLVCDGTSDTCVIAALEGESCDEVDCAHGLTCSWTNQICEPFAELGESCADKPCVDGLYCDDSFGNGDDTCRVLADQKDPGDYCDVDETHACGIDGMISHGLACVDKGGGETICVEAKVVNEGEACNNSSLLRDAQSQNRWCEYSYSTHFCKVSVDDDGQPLSDVGVCARRPGAGEACGPNGECDPDAANCRYFDDDGQWLADEDRVCLALPQVGESCLDGVQGRVCDSDSECDDESNICVDVNDNGIDEMCTAL